MVWEGDIVSDSLGDDIGKYSMLSNVVCVWCGVNDCDEWVGGFVFQAEDGIRDLVRSRGLGDVYKRQAVPTTGPIIPTATTSTG